MTVSMHSSVVHHEWNVPPVRSSSPRHKVDPDCRRCTQFAWQRDEPLPQPKAPKQAIFLALVLLVGGLCTLAYGFLHLAGHVIAKDGAVSLADLDFQGFTS